MLQEQVTKFIFSLIPVMDLQLLQPKVLIESTGYSNINAFEFSEASYAKAMVSDDQAREITAALKRANSDVLKGDDGYYFLFKDNRGGRIYRFGEKYQAEIATAGEHKLALKLNGVYFFELSELLIDSSDEYDVQPSAIRCGIKASEFNYAKFLLEGGRLDSVAVSAYHFEAVDYKGKATLARFILGKHGQLDIEFVNEYTNTHYTGSLSLNNQYQIATWVSDENAVNFEFPEVSFEIGYDGDVKDDLIITSGSSSYTSNATIKKMYDDAPHKDHAFMESLLDYLATYRFGTVHYYRVLPEWIGALTDAPIVSDKQPIPDDNGIMQFEDDAKFWWYPNYQVSSFGERLIDNGQVIFDRVPA